MGLNLELDAAQLKSEATKVNRKFDALIEAVKTLSLQFSAFTTASDKAVGATHRSTSATRIHIKTIEEEIAALIDEKRKVLEQVLDGKQVETSSLLSDLLAKMLNR